jgi:hypothetical protein
MSIASNSFQGYNDDTNAWIPTYTGRRFSPLSPDPAEIDIEDIAHSLSNLCRYGGHSKKFYSVGEHSLLCEELGENRHLELMELKWLLLFDSSKTYMLDIPGPIINFIPAFKGIEYQLLKCIASRFELSFPVPFIIKEIDRIVTSMEKSALYDSGFPWEEEQLGCHDDTSPGGIEIKCFRPEIIEVNFLEKFSQLFK